MKVFTILCFLFSGFAFGNLDSEMANCLTLSNQKEFCEAVGCHYMVITNQANSIAQSVCVSVEKMKNCWKYSNKTARCQRAKCFYDYSRNICYPVEVSRRMLYN